MSYRCRALAGKSRNAAQELHEFSGNEVGFPVAAQSGFHHSNFWGDELGDEENVEREEHLGFGARVQAGAWVWRSGIRILIFPLQSCSYQRGWKPWRLMASQTQRSMRSTRARDKRSRPKFVSLFVFNFSSHPGRSYHDLIRLGEKYRFL